MEFLIAKASETAPQTIRIESAPVKIVPDHQNEEQVVLCRSNGSLQASDVR